MEVNGQLHAQAALLPGKLSPVLIGQEAGRAAEPVWKLWIRENPYSTGNRNRAVQPVTRRYFIRCKGPSS
jgi:hypothetical protein